MTDTIMKLICCMSLLALVGTVSGAGYVTAEKAGIIPMSASPEISSQGEPTPISGDKCDDCRNARESRCSGLNWWDHAWCYWWQSLICQWTVCFI
jgi:hypothetical protein